MGLKMDMVFTNGSIIHIIKAIGKMTNSMAKENTFGKTAGGMWDSGEVI